MEMIAADIVAPVVSDLVGAVEEMAIAIEPEQFETLSEHTKDIILKVMKFTLMMRLGGIITVTVVDVDADTDTDTDRNGGYL